MKEKVFAFVEGKLIACLLFAAGLLFTLTSNATERLSIHNLDLTEKATKRELLSAKDIESFRAFLKQKYQASEILDRDLTGLLNEFEIKDYQNNSGINFSVDSPGPSCAC